MATRLSSLDDDYESGDLSSFPDTTDSRTSLYEVRNNATTLLKFGIPYNGKKVIVEDASHFPPAGILKIGTESGEGDYELVYYAERTDTVFSGLIRGFAKSTQTTWSSGVYVTNSVVAEHHNAIKDALLKIQWYLGVENQPDSNSLNGIIKQLETRFLVPKADFRAYPKKGPPSLSVRFQCLTGGHVLRYLWDFGDGTYSTDKNPTHTYTAEGFYSVKLTVYTTAGGQGITVKNNYIKVSEEEQLTFFYVVQNNPAAPAYSEQTADELGGEAAEFRFVDQTDGDIAKRVWVFGDGEITEVDDPDTHVAVHTYSAAGEYSPSLLIIYTNQSVRRAFLKDTLTIL